MKIISLFILLLSLPSWGQYLTLPLQPGESRTFWEPTSRQYVNVVCVGSIPPAVPPSRKVCELRFNSVSDSCSRYRIYADGLQVSECLADAQTAMRQLAQYQTQGVCSAKAVKPCDLRFNSPSDSCSRYRIYIGESQSSECYADSNSALELMGQFKKAGICY